MNGKAVCLLAVALNAVEHNRDSCHLRKPLQSPTDQRMEGFPFLDSDVRKSGVAPCFIYELSAWDGMGYLASVAFPSSCNSGGSEH